MRTARTYLRDLARIADSYEPERTREKLELLQALERAALPTARDVLRLHEALCFLRAYPDAPALLERVERMLAAFERRADLRRHRRALQSSGIAGTTLHFRFFAPQAERLGQRWPDQLSIDWRQVDDVPRLARLLPLLTLHAERPAFDDHSVSPRQWLHRYVGRVETDATLLVRGWRRLGLDETARDALYDDLDPPLLLRPGSDTPCRTREKYFKLPIVFQARALTRARPDLRVELLRPPISVTALSDGAGAELIELARNTMLPRERDLEVFAYANPDDVRLVDAGGGLFFACIGVLPERRSVLEAVYGFLMLKNGVAIGYALCSALFRSSEIAYNVFETFRGGETGLVFGRLLSAVRHLFGSDNFAIDPYQLGHENDEGLRSGAFWFYQKLGFHPRQAEVAGLMNDEVGRMRAKKGHRSSRAMLRKLSRAFVFWPSQRGRRDVLGALSLSNVALQVSAYLADHHGADRRRALEGCLTVAAARLGVRPSDLRHFTRPERQAWERWAPLIAALPGVEAWRPQEKRALFEVARAKGGRCEGDFVNRFDNHQRLRAALTKMAATAAR